MNPIEDIFMLGLDSDGQPEYCVEVRKTQYNPLARATQHSVTVFIAGTDRVIARGVTNSAKRSYTVRKAQDVLKSQAKVEIDV